MKALNKSHYKNNDFHTIVSSAFSALPCLYVATIAMCLSTFANAQLITFTFDYSSNTAGVGFLNPISGAARQAALTTAGQKFSTMFGSHFSNSGNITLAVSSTDDAFSTNLISAGSEQIYSPGTFGGGEIIRNKLQSGLDLNGTGNDGSIEVNWGQSWQLDPAAPVSLSEFDFYSVISHELTHALGFQTYLSEFGSDPFGNGGEGTGMPGSWTKYDEFLSNGAGGLLINPSTFEVNQATYDNAKTSAVVFEGPNAKAANMGAPVDFYAPGTYSALSSLNHINGTNGNANTLMKYNIDTGSAERDYSEIEKGILTDIGYTPTAVPEPSSISIIALTAGLTFCLRRRA